MPKTKVIVLMGGKSDEREVSLKSGLEVITHLDKKKYVCIPAVVSRDNRRWQITGKTELQKLTSGKNKKVSRTSKMLAVNKPTKNTVVFIAMHGKYGEDGRIQGYLDLLGIPYTGCGVLASAIGMDKIMFKKIMSAEFINTPKQYDPKEVSSIKFPCVVKPANNGSSVGITIVSTSKELNQAIELAKSLDSQVLVEEYIQGTEISCGVIGNANPIALPVIEIRPKNSFFDYEAKYEGKSDEICPAEISKELTKKVQDLAVRVFKAIGAKGFARVDMIIKKDEPYVLEINTIPGLTPESLLPKEAAAAGISYSDLLDKMIALSREN